MQGSLKPGCLGSNPGPEVLFVWPQQPHLCNGMRAGPRLPLARWDLDMHRPPGLQRGRRPRKTITCSGLSLGPNLGREGPRQAQPLCDRARLSHPREHGTHRPAARSNSKGNVPI